jgi:Flp pilus assembly protein TadB
LPPDRIAAFGVGLMAAAVSGMLYHLYLGRFEQVWTARGVFLLVYLVVSALFGLVFLSLI